MSSNLGWLTYKNEYELFVVFSFVISGIFLFINIIKSFRIDAVEKLREKLFTRYINKPDENSLYIIKRRIANQDEILVYRCKTWGSYFLPYVKAGSGKGTDEFKKRIANVLDYDTKDIEINMLLQRYEKSEKYHPQENVVKEYHSYYFHLFAANNFTGNDISKLDTFTIGKKDFEWKTLNEIESDQKTQDKNYDVLDILRKNKSTFITDIAPFK